jgi:hypothetical protein
MHGCQSRRGDAKRRATDNSPKNEGCYPRKKVYGSMVRQGLRVFSSARSLLKLTLSEMSKPSSNVSVTPNQRLKRPTPLPPLSSRNHESDIRAKESAAIACVFNAYGSSACCATAWESLKTASLPPSFSAVGFCSSSCCSRQPRWRAESS